MKRLKDFIDDENFIFNDLPEKPALSPHYFFFEKLENPSITYVTKNPLKCLREDALRIIKDYFAEKYYKCLHTIDTNQLYQNLITNLNKSEILIV